MASTDRPSKEPPYLPWLGEGKHGADPHRFDPITDKSWCLCGKYLWPHDFVKPNLPDGYRHLHCGVVNRAGVHCTVEVGQHVGNPVQHSARVGNRVTGWRTVTWPKEGAQRPD
jgi:hypothetical protein